MGSFFIRRPVFAIVISLLISLAGLLSLLRLPLEQFPEVAPTTVNISASYTGASAETVENTVTQLIEQQLTGLDGMLYFTSTSSASGDASIDVVFDHGVDPDTAQIQVANKVRQVEARLPDTVQDNGVRVTRRQPETFLFVSVYDESNRATPGDMGDYAASNLYDPLSRIEGVGNIDLFGSQYAMRIWLDPYRLRSYNLQPSDIIAAVRSQNVQVAAGAIGAQPAAAEQRLNAVVTAQSMLQTPEEFRRIVVKSGGDGSLVYLGDVSRVELGSESYNTISLLNDHPNAALGLQLADGANTIETTRRVMETVEQLKAQLPPGYAIAYPRDSTQFINRSLSEVWHTLVEAIVLVTVVMYLFLGSWRATVIPALTVPVVLLGTLAALAVGGYSINTLTLFAMVLAIGLLIDDTIVVVENVERLMLEEGLDAPDATARSMEEIGGSLVGIAAVIAVVFLPMAFFGGSTGVIYKQFSLTIIAAMTLSVCVALTLAPALCGLLLVPRQAGLEVSRFQRFIDRATQRYSDSVGRFLRRGARCLLAYAVITLAAVWVYVQLPTGFIPNEDQGGMVVSFNLPAGADQQRTLAVDAAVREYFTTYEKDNLDLTISTIGRNGTGTGQNLGQTWVKLKDWEERPGEDNSAQAIAARAGAYLQRLADAQINVILYPPVRGMGTTDGFELQLQANAGRSREDLYQMQREMLRRAQDDPALADVRSGRSQTAPQLHIAFDKPKLLALGVNLTDAYNTISAAWAGSYVNDFLDRSRIKRVYVQADAAYRSRPENLQAWSVRNEAGGMVSLNEVAQTSMSLGTQTLERYNGLAAVQLQGMPAAGYSSGEAMSAAGKIAEDLGCLYSWSGLSFHERQSAGQALPLYAVSLLIIFLCLAALYESWLAPFAALLVTPLGACGAVAATGLRGLDNNVYFQIALLSVIGLSARNAIMMLSFMEEALAAGNTAVEAALAGARLRLRPILMTAVTFIAGVAPLAAASGVGANSRIAIGTGIIGGTLTGTALTLFFVPLFFVLLKRFAKARKK